LDRENLSKPYVVFALPRSRTAWLADFLTYRDWQCGHEQAMFLRGIGDIRRLLSLPNTGVVETAAAQAWRIIKHHVPGVKMAVIKRPLDDVVQSMTEVDLGGYATYDVPRLRKIVEYGNRMLDEISAQPDVMTLDFQDFDDPKALGDLFEFCLPYKFDPGWWEYMRRINVQADVVGTIRYYHQHRFEIDRFKRGLWAEMRALVRSGDIARHQGKANAIN
jgi:hypothetical protein